MKTEKRIKELESLIQKMRSSYCFDETKGDQARRIIEQAKKLCSPRWIAHSEKLKAKRMENYMM